MIAQGAVGGTKFIVLVKASSLFLSLSVAGSMCQFSYAQRNAARSRMFDPLALGK